MPKFLSNIVSAKKVLIEDDMGFYDATNIEDALTELGTNIYNDLGSKESVAASEVLLFETSFTTDSAGLPTGPGPSDVLFIVSPLYGMGTTTDSDLVIFSSTNHDNPSPLVGVLHESYRVAIYTKLVLTKVSDSSEQVIDNINPDDVKLHEYGNIVEGVAFNVEPSTAYTLKVYYNYSKSSRAKIKDSDGNLTYPRVRARDVEIEDKENGLSGLPDYYVSKDLRGALQEVGYSMSKIDDLSDTLDSHTHDYLPLTGGTVTGDVSMTNLTVSNRVYLSAGVYMEYNSSTGTIDFIIE